MRPAQLTLPFVRELRSREADVCPTKQLSSEERSALAEHTRDALATLCQQLIDSYFTS